MKRFLIPEDLWDTGLLVNCFEVVAIVCKKSDLLLPAIRIFVFLILNG